MGEQELTDTRLYQEIHEQPAVVAGVLAKQRDAVAELAAAIRRRRITHVVVAARGTSDNAARYAQYVLGVRNQLVVGLAAPSIVTQYGGAPRFDGALVLGISQSGSSPDIVAVVAEARRQGALTAVMTNDTASDLAAQGDVAIDLMAGPECAVAATKTYTAELMVLAMLSAALSPGDTEAQAALGTVPDAMRRALGSASAVQRVAERYRDVERAVVIGRGYNYATAFELALKLKELTYAVVEPYSSADFLHGPLAIVERGFPVIVLVPSGSLLDEFLSLIETLQTRQADVVCIGDAPAALAKASMSIEVAPALPEWLSPITLIVPGQLLAMHLAHGRGHDVDSPRAIRKITRTT